MFLYRCLYFLGLLSAILVPQLSVSDENMHIYAPMEYLKVAQSLDHDVRFLKMQQKELVQFMKGIFHQTTQSLQIVALLILINCSSASGYPPIMHLPQAIGIGIASLFNGSTGLTILFGRIANALFYSIAIYFIYQMGWRVW